MILCPCGTGKSYQDCCKKYHDGLLAPTSLDLMRSRYSAFALKNPEYIIHTSHPKNPAFTTNKEAWKGDILDFCEKTDFQKLEILDFSEKEEVGYVTFIAFLSQQGRDVSFQEKSRFEKLNQQWLYRDGEVSTLYRSV